MFDSYDTGSFNLPLKSSLSNGNFSCQWLHDTGAYQLPFEPLTNSGRYDLRFLSSINTGNFANLSRDAARNQSYVRPTDLAETLMQREELLAFQDLLARMGHGDILSCLLGELEPECDHAPERPVILRGN